MTQDERPHIVHFYSSMHTGGIEISLLNILPRLNEGPFRASLCLFADEGSHRETLRDMGVNIYTLPGKGRVNPARIIRLRNFLREQNVAIACAHLHQNYIPVSIAAAMASTPVMLATLHDTKSLKGRAHKIQEMIASRFLIDKYIAVAKPVARNYMRYSGKPLDAYAVIQNGVDIAALQAPATDRATMRANLGLDADEKVIVSAGRVAPGKNFELLIEAAEILKKNYRLTPTFLVAGDEGRRNTGQLEALKDLARATGVAEQFRFLGDRKDIVDLLNTADIYCFTSKIGEGMPVSLLEGQAAGLPLIATDVEGVKEVLVDNNPAALIPPGDAAAMAAKLAELLQDKDAYAAAKAMTAKNSLNFTIEKQVAELEALYTDLLGHSSRSSE